MISEAPTEILSLKVKVDGPKVLGKIDLSVIENDCRPVTTSFKAKKTKFNKPLWYKELLLKTRFCCYCEREFSDELSPTADHIRPHCRGGSNHQSNIAICCGQCNAVKGNKFLMEFYYALDNGFVSLPYVDIGLVMYNVRSLQKKVNLLSAYNETNIERTLNKSKTKKKVCNRTIFSDVDNVPYMYSSANKYEKLRLCGMIGAGYGDGSLTAEMVWKHETKDIFVVFKNGKRIEFGKALSRYIIYTHPVKPIRLAESEDFNEWYKRQPQKNFHIE